MLRAGATTVEVYTSLIYRGWHIAGLINRGLLEILDREGLASVAQLRGAPERDRSRSQR
jgi:dihydroorotate dehydrogenase